MTRTTVRRFVRGMPFLVGWCGAYLLLSVLEVIDAGLELAAFLLAYLLAGAAFIAALLYGICGCGALLLGAIGLLAPGEPGLAAILWRTAVFFGAALGFAFAGTGVVALPDWLNVSAGPKRRRTLRVAKQPRFGSMEKASRNWRALPWEP